MVGRTGHRQAYPNVRVVVNKNGYLLKEMIATKTLSTFVYEIRNKEMDEVRGRKKKFSFAVFMAV